MGKRYADPGVRTEAIVLLTILALCSGLGLGIGRLGPVGEGRSAHWVRGVGYAAVGLLALSFVGSNRFPLGQPHADPGGWWIAALAVTSYLVTAMVATASTSPLRAAVLTRSSLIGCSAASAWWIAMLLIPAVRVQHVWGVLCVLVAMLVAGLWAVRRPESATQGLLGALLSGTASCMLIFIAAVGTYAIVPGMVPDVAGQLGGGLTAADRVMINRIGPVWHRGDGDARAGPCAGGRARPALGRGRHGRVTPLVDRGGRRRERSGWWGGRCQRG